MIPQRAGQVGDFRRNQRIFAERAVSLVRLL